MSRNLAAILLNRNMSQSDLARATNVPQPSISRFITGTSKTLGVRSAWLISQKLNITMEQLYDFAPLQSVSDIPAQTLPIQPFRAKNHALRPSIEKLLAY